MNVGIVVEGPSDRATYPILMQKIRNDIVRPQIRECHGKSNLKNMFVGFLKEFEQNPAWQINAAFVICDSDCKPPAQIEEQLRMVLRGSGFDPRFRVEFFATKCQLETWLLADENAINQVSQQKRKNKQVAPIAIPLESHEKAKELFHQQLSKADLRATPQIYSEIARATDIARIEARCPHFRNFIDKVRAC